MPRNQNAGNLALRNRNRVTNKTRLKVIKGNIDADPIVLDEDEERARVISTAGVDAEDANEHHLQAVLSAASHRATSLGQKATRTSSTDNGTVQSEPSTAFIPVPDAAGLVDNYEELYPPGRWTQPVTYVKSSDVADEYTRHALSDGFTYYMDERDAEWLEKNNKEAKGEGTSAQGSIAVSGTTTRSSLRTSTKSKGKETELFTPTLMQEDEFEFVMGVFERLTHDNTPFLHVNLQRGTGVPPFSAYEEHFSTDLTTSMFATFLRPSDIPQPTILSKMARAVYPHWKTRRVDREGHRIIPTLNFDESDTKNESYICFRRREIKAIRKTRTAQVSSSEKLIRLKAEFANSLQLAQQVLTRESQKVEAKSEAQHVWEKRCAFVDLKRKFPALGTKDDEELLIDKPKKPKVNDNAAAQVLRIKNRSSLDNGSSPSPTDPYIRPRDRTNTIQIVTEEHLKRQKERDHGWDDLIDNPFQADPLSFAERSFKSFSSAADSDQAIRPVRFLRLRYGRGGRMHLDRRIPLNPARDISFKVDSSESLKGFSEGELAERNWRHADRWKFDPDSQPVWSEGTIDEEDRVMLDDYDKKYLRHSIRLISEQDQISINTDPKLHLAGPDGVRTVIPFRTSAATQNQSSIRRDAQSTQRLPQLPTSFPPQANSTSHQNTVATLSSGTPVSMQTPIRKMLPPSSVPQVRVPSNGAVRVPAHINSTQPNATMLGNTVIPSNTSSGTPPDNNIPNTVLGMDANLSKRSFLSPSNVIALPNSGIPSNTGAVTNGHELMAPVPVNTPVRPQSQNQHHQSTQQISLPNGFPNTMTNIQFNGFSNGIPTGYANHLSNQQRSVLSMQQTQNLKVAFPALPGNQSLPQQPSLPSVNGVPTRPPSAYTQHLPNGPSNANMNGLNMVPLNMTLKLPNNRQLQLAASNMNSRPQSVPVANGIDLLHSPNFTHSSPNTMIRAPSANGHHMSPSQRTMSSPQSHYVGQGQSNGSPTNGHHIVSHSPHLGVASQIQLTPPRAIQTPVPIPSPSIQHQQVVGGSLHQGSGY